MAFITVAKAFFKDYCENNIIKQMSDNILCPRCSLAYWEDQPLSRDAEDPDTLFCPRCSLEVTVTLHWKSESSIPDEDFIHIPEEKANHE